MDLATTTLYSSWTGDGIAALKQAERTAWLIEEWVAANQLGCDCRIGLERDLAEQFGTGLGVMREAVRLLEARYVCVIRRGPGGGIFMTCPSEKAIAQTAVNYLVRAGVTAAHFAEAEEALALARTSATASANVAVTLFAECLDQLRPHVIEERAAEDKGGRAPGRRTPRPSTPFRWQYVSPGYVSRARQVARRISDRVADGTYPSNSRLGSEADLCAEFRISRISMRQTIRLLESSGILASRPGRGNGLTVSAPEPLPAIRTLGGFFLVRDLSYDGWREAMDAIGVATLALAIRRAGMAQRDACAARLRQLTATEETDRIALARTHVRALVELAANPILDLLWRALVGYVFRAVPKDHSFHTAPRRELAVWVPRIYEAVLRGDAAAAAAAYREILPRPPGWTLSSDRRNLV